MKELRAEATALEEALADVTLENRLLKRSMIGGEPMTRQWSERHWRAETTHEIPRLRD